MGKEEAETLGIDLFCPFSLLCQSWSEAPGALLSTTLGTKAQGACYLLSLFPWTPGGSEQNKHTHKTITQTYHHHECKNPGGSPNVMFFSHRI